MASVNNIERFREERDWKRPHLAKLMNTTPQQIERLEKGQRKLTQEWIDRAALAFGVDPAEIISAAPSAITSSAHSKEPARPTDHKPTRTVDAGETVNITQLDLSLSMGPGTIIDQWVESEPVAFDLAFIRRITRAPPGRLRLVTGIGRSMEPTLQDGDTVLIDTMDTMLARQDGIYWISVYGASGIKRLRAVGQDTVLVISDNKDVAPQEVAKCDLRIEGRAIWAARGL